MIYGSILIRNLAKELTNIRAWWAYSKIKIKTGGKTYDYRINTNLWNISININIYIKVLNFIEMYIKLLLIYGLIDKIIVNIWIDRYR